MWEIGPWQFVICEEVCVLFLIWGVWWTRNDGEAKE